MEKLDGNVCSCNFLKQFLHHQLQNIAALEKCHAIVVVPNMHPTNPRSPGNTVWQSNK